MRELVPGERLVMSTDEGPFPMETTYEWADEPGGGTRMTLRNRGGPSGFAKVGAPMMAGGDASRKAQGSRPAEGDPGAPMSLAGPAGLKEVKAETGLEEETMADVTVASFDQMEPIYEGLARRARATLGVSGWGMQVLTLPPNWEGYPNHKHDAGALDPDQEEVYIPIEGSGRLHADGEVFDAAAGDDGPGRARAAAPGTSRAARWRPTA